MPLVSVITPSYNSADFIAKTIDSVREQTHEHWEMIIVDDCSSDETVTIIKHYKNEDDRIKLIQLTKNSGAAVARNKGIEMAKGDYIAFLDADDLWKPHKLSKQVQFMQQNDIAVAYSAYEQIDEAGKPLNKTVHVLPKLSFEKLLSCNYIGNLTGIYDAKKLGKIYSPLIRKRQDWGLWLSCVEKAGGASGISESLAYYRIREGSISSNKIKLLKHNYNFYRKACNFGTFRSSFYLMRFLFEHFFVKARLIKKNES
ncbi:glycosyltransferase family 2 protein [Sungkyunkwania multivorans]|uniref:Glycosyltransferase family 2 protein n=1 Tax=Sungkyunkwania multivorans TaxID=1173618 RepID=A0ABW3D0X8_9FLAO